MSRWSRRPKTITRRSRSAATSRPRPRPPRAAPTADVTSDDGAGLRIFAWTAEGLGSAALLASVGTLAYALERDAAASRAGCQADTCPTSDGLAASNDALTAGVATAALLSLGITGAVTGTAILLQPVASADRAGLVLSGAF